MCRPHRGQARSHNGSGCPQIPHTRHKPCGSELARDGGVSGAMDTECAGLIAGKPAPTMDLWCPQIPHTHHKPCGSELARDGGMSGAMDTECAGLIAGKPAPTMDLWCPQTLHTSPKTCGSELARDGGVSGAMDIECGGLIAGKPAPTMVLWCPQIPAVSRGSRAPLGRADAAGLSRPGPGRPNHSVRLRPRGAAAG